jgi:hypothetical protein
MLNARVLNGQAIDSAGILYVWHNASAAISADTDMSYDDGDIFLIREATSDVQCVSVLGPEAVRIRQVYSDILLSTASINAPATIIFGAEGHIYCPSVVIAGVTISAFAGILCSADVAAIVTDELGESAITAAATINVDATRIRLTVSCPTGLCTSSLDVNDSGVLVTQYVYSDIDALALISTSVGIKASGAVGFTVEAYIDIYCDAIISINSGLLFLRQIEIIGEAFVSTDQVAKIQHATANIECLYIEESPIATLYAQLANISCGAVVTTLTSKINASQADISCNDVIVSYACIDHNANADILSTALITENINFIRAADVDVGNGTLIEFTFDPVIWRGAIAYIDGGVVIVFVDDEVRKAIQVASYIACTVDIYMLAILWVLADVDIACTAVIGSTIYSNIDIPAPEERTIYVDCDDRTITIEEEDRIIQVA